MGGLENSGSARTRGEEVDADVSAIMALFMRRGLIVAVVASGGFSLLGWLTWVSSPIQPGLMISAILLYLIVIGSVLSSQDRKATRPSRWKGLHLLIMNAVLFAPLFAFLFWLLSRGD